MDIIIQFITGLIEQSATAALAAFAMWMVKNLYDERLVERDAHTAQRLVERDAHTAQRLEERADYTSRLESINILLLDKLDEGNRAVTTSTEVIRNVAQVLQEVQRDNAEVVRRNTEVLLLLKNVLDTPRQ